MNHASPTLLAAIMLVVLLLPTVSVAANNDRKISQAWQGSPDVRREIQQTIGALLQAKRVSGSRALSTNTVTPFQVGRTVSIRFAAEWRQGYDFARDAVIEINGARMHDWVFTHSTDQTFQDTIDTTVSNTISAYTIYARDDDLQSRYYGHLYVDGNLVASSDDAGPLTPLVYVIPPSGGPERLEIADVNYPRSVLTGESFVIDVTVSYVLNSPREVVVDLYENAGPLLASKRMMLSAEGSAIYDLMVTAPSTARRWQLNIHLQGEYKQSIYIDVGQVCDEGAVNVLVMCPDGSTWEHRQVCRNNAWVDEYQNCPACSEGTVRNVVMCPDGVNWKQREVCRNNNWVPEHQTCPTVDLSRIRRSAETRLVEYQKLRDVFDPNTHIDQAIDDLTSLQTALVEEFIPSWEDLIPELSEDAIAFKDIIEKTKQSFDLLSESQKAWVFATIDAWLYPKVHSDPRLQHLYGCTGSYAVCQIDRIVSLVHEEANAAERNDVEDLKRILARETDEVSALSTLLEYYKERGSSDDMAVPYWTWCWWHFLPYPCQKNGYPIRDAAEAAMQLASIDKEYIEYAYGVL